MTYKNASECQNGTDYVYQGLKLGGRYRFRVIASRYSQSSDPSEPSYAFTNGETGLTCIICISVAAFHSLRLSAPTTAPSGPPVNVVARTLAYNSIELSWDPPEYFRGALGLLYKIYASSNPGALEEVRVGEVRVGEVRVGECS